MTAPTPRKVPATTAWRVAQNTLGRMACHYLDPTRDGHDHDAECLVDDESYVADLLLKLVAPAVTGNEDLVLERLTDLLDRLDTDA